MVGACWCIQTHSCRGVMAWGLLRPHVRRGTQSQHGQNSLCGSTLRGVAPLLHSVGIAFVDCTYYTLTFGAAAAVAPNRANGRCIALRWRHVGNSLRGNG